MTVALIGVDGAGKSTLSRELAKWLAWRTNAIPFYMGRSHPSMRTRVFKAIEKLAVVGHEGARRLAGSNSRLTRGTGSAARLSRCVRAVMEAHDRYGRYVAARRSATRGAIIIFDRYPLSYVRGFERAIDGPRIASLANGHLGDLARRLAAAEERLYRRIRPADHYVVLHVSPAVSRARKPGDRADSLEQKLATIDLALSDTLGVTHLDADQSFDAVLLNAKAALWRLL